MYAYRHNSVPAMVEKTNGVLRLSGTLLILRVFIRLVLSGTFVLENYERS